MIPETTRPVLPPLPPPGLTSIDELLSADERAALSRDLAEMARLRRRAAAESAHLVIGGGT